MCQVVTTSFTKAITCVQKKLTCVQTNFIPCPFSKLRDLPQNNPSPPAINSKGKRRHFKPYLIPEEVSVVNNLKV